ncbi:MAG: hypothetical protein EXQ60_08550 [Candidatus Nanopelagicales bacterium]|nr:hypothetical protein [Candidatus Nanopelagicales bacterium]
MQDLRTRRIVTAISIMAVAALLGVAPALAATDVRPIIVPGQSTPIQGVAQQLPPVFTPLALASPMRFAATELRGSTCRTSAPSPKAPRSSCASG